MNFIERENRRGSVRERERVAERGSVAKRKRQSNRYRGRERAATETE